MTEENEMKRHLFLYAKLHYHKEDAISDIATIIGKFTALSPEYVSRSCIVDTLLNCVYPVLKNRGAGAFGRFFNGYELSNNSIVSTCLNFMALVKVSELDFPLGEPDPNILPLSRQG